ncbi:MAG TPA: NAD(P)/FAD-dependent oxidoreductase [Verrucomicrobiae bacterium]|nr:NAD(P)/FAD-dependent oxidoreductase [Verrucomicrobiae bacterium]
MTDILIIGAGPAGSTAAAMLVRRGFKVLVLEKQKFPRFSVGESLLAQTLGLIDEAGMLEPVLNAGFQFKNGAVFVRGQNYGEYNFVNKSSPGYGWTFEVPRADFDKVLIDEAERLGAEVRYEVEITACEINGGKPKVTAKDKSGKVEVHHPKFVLDASGFGRTLPRLLELEEPSTFPLRSALFTQVYDHIPSGEFDRQKIRVVIHPTRQDVWYWLIPFSNGKVSIGCVAEADFLAPKAGQTPEDRLWELIGEDKDLAHLMRNRKPAMQVNYLKGYAANVRTMTGPGFALLGNAAEFLDPVFSSGVTIAMKSANMAVKLLERQLKNGENIDWKTEFEEPLRYGVETFRAFVTTWYDGRLQDIFFHQPQEPRVHRMVCSVLAGYAWDKDNYYTGPQALRRLSALAHSCRSSNPAAAVA